MHISSSIYAVDTPYSYISKIIFLPKRYPIFVVQHSEGINLSVDKFSAYKSWEPSGRPFGRYQFRRSGLDSIGPLITSLNPGRQ